MDCTGPEQVVSLGAYTVMFTWPVPALSHEGCAFSPLALMPQLPGANVVGSVPETLVAVDEQLVLLTDSA